MPLIILLISALFLSTTQTIFSGFYSSKTIPDSYQNFGTPRDLITLPNDQMWYVDSQNSRLIKIDSSGEILRTVGRAGDDEGEFANDLTSITRDNEGYLYALDFCHVYKLDFNGGFVESFASCGDSEEQISEPKAIHYSEYSDVLWISDFAHHRVVKFDTDGNYLSSFGSQGTGEGQFTFPHGLTTDSSGNVYVVDTDNHRVQVFTSSGVFIRSFGSNDEESDDYLNFPKDVEVLDDGSVLVTSQNTPKIKKFSSSGSYLMEWGENGTADQQFVHPEYLTKANDGSIWVTDWHQKRLQHFSDDGDFLGLTGNSSSSPGEFVSPFALDFDGSGNIYILDSTGRVQKFDSDGDYLATILDEGEAGSAAYHLAISPDGQYIIVSSEAAVAVYDQEGELVNYLGTQGINGPNSGEGDFDHARGMAFDSQGYLYVTDLFNARVQKFDLSNLTDPDFSTTYAGGFVEQWSAMNYVEYIFIDSSDNIYLSASEWQEEDGLKIERYNTDGELQAIYLDDFGEEEDQYYKIGGIFVNDDGDLYLSDSYYNRIQVYDSAGTYLETIGGPGSGSDQFEDVRYARFNQFNGDLVAIDSGNHRVHLFRDGVKILNLIESVDVIETDNSLSLVRNTFNPLDLESTEFEAELFFGDYLVSDFSVDLAEDRDWQSVGAIILPDESRSLIVNLNPDDAPGVSETHSLYVVKNDGQSSVKVCPEANLIAEVSLECEGYVLNEGDEQLSVVSIGDINYWKITGLTGTGAIAINDDELTDEDEENDEEDDLNNEQAPSENSGSNGTSGSNPQMSYCSAPAPSATPDLFQIDVTANTAKLFFTPISNTSDFYISFSNSPIAEEHGELVNLLREGVQSHTVFHLKPNTDYYFKVRGHNGCSSGEWSNVMKIRTGTGILETFSYYKNISSQFLNSKSTNSLKKSPKTVVSEASDEKTIETNYKPTYTPSQDPELEKTQLPFVNKEKEQWCFLWWCFDK